MGELLVIGLLLAVCILGPLFGVDSIPRDERDRRGWWPGTRA